MAFPGFNNSKKRGTISRGDFDRDGVSNRKDCEPLNFRKQGPEHEEEKFSEWVDKKVPYDKERSHAAGEARAKEMTEEYFLGKDPRKHKDFKHFKGGSK